MISRGLCVLGVVALVIALLTTYDSSSSTKAGSFYVTAPELGGRPVFFLGPGCGHVSYTMGFVGRLFLEDNETRAMMESAGAVFGGVSSGAITAAYANAVLFGNYRRHGGNSSSSSSSSSSARTDRLGAATKPLERTGVPPREAGSATRAPTALFRRRLPSVEC